MTYSVLYLKPLLALKHNCLLCTIYLFFFFSEQAQPLEGLHAGCVNSNWNGRLLVCLHTEPLLKRPHEEDDERSGGPAES